MTPISYVTLSTAHAVLPVRTRYRQEMNCQIVKDSIHTRDGWTLTYALGLAHALVGFGTVAIAGPWKDKPTILEFYILPEHRSRAFDLFEAFLAASGARQMEIQSSDVLLAAMFHTYARNVASEAIVFRDQVTTALPANRRQGRHPLSLQPPLRGRLYGNRGAVPPARFRRVSRPGAEAAGI
jgi:hypothetical protein